MVRVRDAGAWDPEEDPPRLRDYAQLLNDHARDATAGAQTRVRYRKSNV
jgi:hypothetical protein